jgi:hypothetical protein
VLGCNPQNGCLSELSPRIRDRARASFGLSSLPKRAQKPAFSFSCFTENKKDQFCPCRHTIAGQQPTTHNKQQPTTNDATSRSIEASWLPSWASKRQKRWKNLTSNRCRCSCRLDVSCWSTLRWRKRLSAFRIGKSNGQATNEMMDSNLPTNYKMLRR